MRSKLTLEYWQDGEFYVGRLIEAPGVFNQGELLDELRENIRDANGLMVIDERAPPDSAQRNSSSLNCEAAGVRTRASRN